MARRRDESSRRFGSYRAGQRLRMPDTVKTLGPMTTGGQYVIAQQSCLEPKTGTEVATSRAGEIWRRTAPGHQAVVANQGGQARAFDLGLISLQEESREGAGPIPRSGRPCSGGPGQGYHSPNAAAVSSPAPAPGPSLLLLHRVSLSFHPTLPTLFLSSSPTSVAHSAIRVSLLTTFLTTHCAAESSRPTLSEVHRPHSVSTTPSTPRTLLATIQSTTDLSRPQPKCSSSRN
jgi:hypothetical protein